jgi:hypothetical protein
VAGPMTANDTIGDLEEYDITTRAGTGHLPYL